MTQQTAEQALEKLKSIPQADLYDMCQEAHKDFTGVRGRHMYTWSVEELADWWTSHYVWDEASQCWGWKNGEPPD